MRPSTKDTEPFQQPGICCRCRVGGSADRKYFVDTGVSYDYEGVLYFCNMCLADIVHTSEDYLSLVDVEEMMGHNVELASMGTAVLAEETGFFEWAKTNFFIDLATLKTKYLEYTTVRDEINGSRISTESGDATDETVGDSGGADSITLKLSAAAESILSL